MPSATAAGYELELRWAEVLDHYAHELNKLTLFSSHSPRQLTPIPRCRCP
jgi:hypothetical protein